MLTNEAGAILLRRQTYLKERYDPTRPYCKGREEYVALQWGLYALGYGPRPGKSPGSGRIKRYIQRRIDWLQARVYVQEDVGNVRDFDYMEAEALQVAINALSAKMAENRVNYSGVSA